MEKFKKRLPNKEEIQALFILSVFTFHIWSVPMFLYRVPGMLFYLGIGDLIHVAAYNQAFSLIECVIITGVSVLLCVLMPQKYFKDHFVLQGAFLIILTAIWAILYHVLEIAVSNYTWVWVNFLEGLSIPSPTLRDWLATESGLFFIVLSIWMTLYLWLFLLSPQIARKNRSQRKRVIAFADRASVLTTVFVLIDLTGLAIVVANNAF